MNLKFKIFICNLLPFKKKKIINIVKKLMRKSIKIARKKLINSFFKKIK